MLVHVLQRETIVMSVQANSNNNENLVGDCYLPIRGTLRDSTIRNARFEEDNAAHCLKDRRKDDERACIHPKILFQDKKGIVVCHRRIHYDAIADPNTSKLLIEWPNNESSTMSQSQVSNRQCTSFCMHSCECDTVEYNLYHSRVRNDERKERTACYEDLDVSDWDTIFCCKRCPDALVKHYNTICEEKTVDGVISD